MKTDIIQKAIVVNARGEMLLLRRSNSDTRRPLQWDLPGGFLEPGESLEQGVIREIDEEAGYAVVDLKLIYTKTEYRTWGESNERNAIFLFYATHVESDEVRLSYEHDKYVWLTFDEALNNENYTMHPLHRELLQYVHEKCVEL